MKKIKRDKALKIAFIVSWMPILLLLIIAIWSALFGVTFMFDKTYGWDAFILIIIAYGYLMAPLLIAALAYQIFYIAYKVIKKK